MTIEIHYGGVVYKMADPDVEDDVIVGEIAQGLRSPDPGQQYTFRSTEGLVTLFLNSGTAVAVVETAESTSAYAEGGLAIT